MTKLIENWFDLKTLMYIFFKVGYNACGHVLLPLVLHTGHFSDEIKADFRECFGFIKTADGHIDHTAVYNMLCYVHR